MASNRYYFSGTVRKLSTAEYEKKVKEGITIFKVSDAENSVKDTSLMECLYNACGLPEFIIEDSTEVERVFSDEGVTAKLG